MALPFVGESLALKCDRIGQTGEQAVFGYCCPREEDH